MKASKTLANMTIILFLIVVQTSAALSRECTEIENGLDRLACYDKKYRPTETEITSSVGKSNWLVRSDKSEFKDTTDVYVSVSSNEELTCNRFGSGQKATLMLRCLENTSSLFIVTNCHVSSGFQGYGRVEYRIDDRKSQTRSFDASTDNRALGLWSGGKSIPLIKQLFGAQNLLVRFTPFSMSPVTAEFDIEGVETAVEGLRKECGW